VTFDLWLVCSAGRCTACFIADPSRNSLESSAHSVYFRRQRKHFYFSSILTHRARSRLFTVNELYKLPTYVHIIQHILRKIEVKWSFGLRKPARSFRLRRQPVSGKRPNNAGQWARVTAVCWWRLINYTRGSVTTLMTRVDDSRQPPRNIVNNTRDPGLQLCFCCRYGGNPSHSYGASPAIWDHAVLPATRHR